MQDSLETALRIAASGLQAQSTRLRIVSQNIANAQSTGSTPGADPYARQTVSFESEMDRTLGANLVQSNRSASIRLPSSSSMTRAIRRRTKMAW